MKKTIWTSIVLILASVICLTGCDSNSGKRPWNYKNTVWTEQSIDFRFWVDDKYYDTTGTNTYGILVVDGEEIPVYLLFAHDNRVSVMPLSSYRKEFFNGVEDYSNFTDEFLFEGHGYFNKTSFKMKDLDDRGYLPEGTEELTFIREDC